MSREYFSTARKCLSSPPSCSQLLAFPRCVDKLKDKVETFSDDWAQGKIVNEKKSDKKKKEFNGSTMRVKRFGCDNFYKKIDKDDLSDIFIESEI